MLTKNIYFKNFSINSKTKKVDNIFKNIKKNYFLGKDKLLHSLSENYKYSYNKNFINKFKKEKKFRIIGMGGSILGTEAIYSFLRKKISKTFYFINNIDSALFEDQLDKKIVNIIISKSGNTLETISNSNLLLRKSKKNIFITELKKSYLNDLANKLRGEIIEHKNFIGGRFSVLSEVGMLPAQLMGLNERKFKQFNKLIENKKFVINLIKNVDSTLYFLSKKKYNSIILNYDPMSENLFYWYQQLIAESLGKKSKGILPIVSNMPKDNHSLMQLYLDGPKKYFYTFFSVREKNKNKFNSHLLLESHLYLKNKDLGFVKNSQREATEKVFKMKKIPFRSFDVSQRNEESISELFCFFILETILLGRAMNVNPFDQPSVELIKKETKKIFIKN